MKKTIGLLAFLLLSSNLYAGNFQLDNISQSEVDDLTRELAADWIFTTVSSPKMTGDLIPGFGLEIGVVAGITEAPTWEKLIKEEDPDTDIDKLPYLNLLASFSIKPLGLSFELGLIPKQTSDNASIKNTSFGVKWTFLNGAILKTAFRAHYTNNELKFNDTINNSSTGNTDIEAVTEFATSVYGIQLLAGADFAIIEPYVGVGVVRSNSEFKLSATGSTTIFENDITLTADGSAESDKTSPQALAGFVLDLFVINIGVEYMYAHETSRIAGKFSINI